MKKTAFFLFATLFSLSVAAQVNFSADSIETGTRSKITGALEYKTVHTKSSINITDTCIILTDDLGKQTKLRIFAGQADILTQIDVNPGAEIFFQTIDDKTGKFWDVHYSTGEFGAKTFHMSNDSQVIHFRGKEQ